MIFMLPEIYTNGQSVKEYWKNGTEITLIPYQGDFSGNNTIATYSKMELPKNYPGSGNSLTTAFYRITDCLVRKI